MNATIKGQIPKEIWADYTYNKMLWYGAIETKARAEGLLDDLPGIDRAYTLYQDAKEMTGGDFPKFRQESADYHRYILDLPKGLVAAHLYVWHMGDLFGGQMILRLDLGSVAAQSPPLVMASDQTILKPFHTILSTP